MKKAILKNCLVTGMLCASALAAHAATHYLVTPDMPGAAPAKPFTNWATAGTSVIDVVNAAMSDATAPRTIWVTNGTYILTNRVTITNDVVMQSVNGREVTIFNGNNLWNFRLWHTNCVLSGVTITNGYSPFGGGGVRVDCGTVTNCLITDCTNSTPTGGVGGGGVIIMGTGIVANCVIRRNTSYSDGGGGGITLRSESRSTVENCIVEYNRAGNSHGGGFAIGYTAPLTAGIVVRNCLIRCNITDMKNSTYGGGIYLGGSSTNNLMIANCTIVCNTGRWTGGISKLGSVYPTNPIVFNCIIVSNTGPDAPNIHGVGSNAVIYSCSTWMSNTWGQHFILINGNTTNDPQFTSFTEGDFRFNRFSPCFNSGTNQSWMTNAIDLDGHGRVLHGRVDMGAYELFIPSGTMFIVR